MSAFEPVERLLRHRAPMLLVDEVVSWERGKLVVARHRVRADEPFAQGGRVPALVSLEYMAQAVGLYAGLEALDRAKPAPLGYLVACREMSCAVADFAQGDELQVRAEWVWGEAQIGQFRCATERGGVVVARAVISVYAPPGRAEEEGG